MKSKQKRKPANQKTLTKNSKGKSSRLKIAKTRKPESLNLEEWQRALRKQYGEKQNFQLENIGEHPVFSEFLLTNPASGKTYKIAVRGTAPFENYCSCPDYSINGLGTCKHLAFALAKLAKVRGAEKAFKEGYTPPYSEVYLSYGLKREVRFKAGENAPTKLLSLAKVFFTADGILKEERVLDFNKFLNALSHKSTGEVRCYDDVLAFVAERQDVEHRRQVVNSHLKEGQGQNKTTYNYKVFFLKVDNEWRIERF